MIERGQNQFYYSTSISKEVHLQLTKCSIPISSMIAYYLLYVYVLLMIKFCMKIYSKQSRWCS